MVEYYIHFWRKFMDMIRLALIGIAIGMANVIPGVSGGTLAVVFNIYDKFVNAITPNVKKLIANWRFILPLLGGMAVGVLIFSKLITILYSKFPVQTNFFFTGLIIGSIPLLFGFMAKSENGEKMSLVKKITVVICALAGLLALLFFTYLEVKFGGSEAKAVSEGFVLPPLSTKLAARIFIAGFIGAVAMIIPGISGSLLMLILGVYTIVMGSIPALFTRDMVHAFLLLLPNGIGVIIGLISGAQLVKWLIKKVPNHTYAVIFGLLCGSAINIFPGFSAISGVGAAIACVLCLLGGAAMAYFSAKLAPEEASGDNPSQKQS